MNCSYCTLVSFIWFLCFIRPMIKNFEIYIVISLTETKIMHKFSDNLFVYNHPSLHFFSFEWLNIPLKRDSFSVSTKWIIGSLLLVQCNQLNLGLGAEHWSSFICLFHLWAFLIFFFFFECNLTYIVHMLSECFIVDLPSLHFW